MNGSFLNDNILELEQRYAGQFSMDVRRLDRPGRFVLREHNILPTASTCKLFVLCELFRQAECGLLDLNEPLAARPDHWCGGGGVLRAMRLEQELSLHNMAVLMIIISDNVATAALVERLGADNVEQTARAWGLNDTTVAAGLDAWTKTSEAPEPVSSAHDLCSLLKRLDRRELLSEESCSAIIGILRAQRCNDMLPRYLPLGQDWGHSEQWIAGKTGYGACTVETGIVHCREANFCLAVFFKLHEHRSPRFKCLADHPPVLAVAEACRSVYQSMLG